MNMGDEYQLRKDIDKIWNGIWDYRNQKYKVVLISDFNDTLANYYTQNQIDTLFYTVTDRVYPIGSVYLTTKDDTEFDPNDEFIGKWVSIDLGLSAVYAWERIDETE